MKVSSSYRIKKTKRIFFKKFNMKSLNRDIKWKKNIAVKQKKIAKKLFTNNNTILYCPICHSSKHNDFVIINKYKYSECSNCGHIFLKTPHSIKANPELYSGKKGDVNSFQDKIYANEKLFNCRLNNIAIPKVKFVYKSLPFLKNKKGIWVDIGSGGGELIYAVNKFGWKGIGVESDIKLVNYSQKIGVEVIPEYFNKNNAKKIITSKTQIVSLINILEHIVNPKELLKLISKNLLSKNYLLLEVPRHPSISSLSCQSFPEYTGRHIYVPEHLHIFTEKSIEILLKKNGFKPINIWVFGQDIYELLTSVMLKSKLKSHALNNEILNIAGDLQRVVDKNNLSDTMLILSKKI